MTIPTPPADRPFDPHAFPGALLSAQRELAALYAELHSLQERLPWSRLEHSGWEAQEEHGRMRKGREATKGWEPEDAAEYDRLRKEIRKKAAFVHCHAWWGTVAANGHRGAGVVDARQELKRAAAAGPSGDAVARTAA